MEASLTLLETAEEAVVVPGPVVGTTDAQGVCILTLFRNAAGQAGSRYRIRLTGADGRTETMYAVVPDAPAARLDDILVDREFSAPPATVAGESAYQVAVRNGFSGTEAQWLASLTGPPGPGVVSDADLTFTSPDDTTLRVGKVGTDGIARYVDLVLVQPPAPDAPTLADIEPYRTSSTSWSAVPYGNASWPEPGMGTFYQVVDIDVPSGTPPAAGWPVVVYFHANGADRVVGSGGTVGTNVKLPALAAGYAFASVEFRHPVTNVNQGAPHTDVGLALQYLRSLHQALSLDRSKVFGVARSRGNLALWQTVQADMSNDSAPTYMGRQSSRLQGLWCINPQIAYSVQRFCDLYIQPADHAAVLAANPDDSRWKNAIDDIPTVTSLPPIVSIHEAAYFGALVSKATLDAWDAQPNNSPLHYPDAGLKLKAAYEARSLGHQCAIWDDELDNIEQHADMVTWMRYVLEGMSSVEALAMARALRRAAQAHYIADDISGVFVNSDGSGGAPPADGVIGAIVAGQHGLANRTAPTPLGYGAGQNTALNKPKRKVMASGHNGILFDSTDRLSVGMNSDGTPNWVGWTDTGEVTTLASASTANYTFGQAPLDGRTLALSIGSDAAITTNDMKVYRSFASVWAGRAYP